MKKTIAYIYILVLSVIAAGSHAQTSDDVQTLLLSHQKLSLKSSGTTRLVKVKANNEYTVTTSADWLSVEKDGNTVRLKAETNYSSYSRQTTVLFATADGALKRPLTVEQEAENSINDLTSGELVNRCNELFTDMSWTELKPEVTQNDIDGLGNVFVEQLATGLLNGTYDKTYRVNRFDCILSTTALADLWLCPGKSYDKFEGVTGIHVPANSTIGVCVSGIPSNLRPVMKIVAWYIGLDGESFDGGNPVVKEYTLHNGFNLINYNYEWGGLAYVTYSADTDPDSYDPITVHIVNGIQNGILTPDKTNDEMYAICQNATDLHVDCLGSKVHSVWTADGLLTKCKSDRSQPKAYRQFLNVLDTIVQWEHDLLGFTKYDRIPRNHSFAYTNYTYFMFQGGLGVSFHHNQEVNVLNARYMLYTTDALWGFSHEWGHQHQMHPYFCWAGTAEITNNLNSYYNIMRVGNKNSGFTRNWDVMLNYFLNHSGGVTVNNARTKMKGKQSHWSFSPKMEEVVESMTAEVPTYAADPMRSQSIWDFIKYDGNDKSQPSDPILPLTAFLKLFTWSYLDLGLKDICPDFYESLRRISQDGGSDIEKPSGWDKYELIALAQNHNVGGAYAKLVEAYPTSCWVTDNYLNKGAVYAYYNTTPFILNYIRKWSRLTGYDLTPYFDVWGFFRTVAIHMQDYTSGSFIMTQNMIDEFKADMQALVDDGTLKTLSEEQLNALLHTEPFNTSSRQTFKTPTIPN